MDSFSPETTVDTDMTVTASGESEIQKTSNTIVTNEKRLIRDVQVLKLQLAQKEIIFEGLKADYLSQTDDLQEKLADAVYQKQIMQLRLESQLKFLETSSSEKESALREEIQKLKARHSEAKDTVVWNFIQSVKDNLSNPAVYSGHYKCLKEKSNENMTAEDHLLLFIYEKVGNQGLRTTQTDQDITSCRENADKKGGKLKEALELKTIRERIHQQRNDEVKGLKHKILNLHKENCEMQKELVKWKILCEEAEGSVTQIRMELQSSQQAREELLKKLSEFRKNFQDTYASAFQQEVDSVKAELQYEIQNLKEQLQHASADKESFELWRKKCLKQISELRNSLRQIQRAKNDYQGQLDEQKRDHVHLDSLHKDAVDQLQQQIVENRRLRLKIEVLKQEVENLQGDMPVQRQTDSSDRDKFKELRKKESEDFQRQLSSMSSELTQLRSEHAKLQSRHLELISDMNTIVENRKAMETIKEQVTTLEKQLVLGNVQTSTVPEWMSMTKS